MQSVLSTVRENPDDYPLTNVRWSYGIAFFVAPCALVGIQEGNPKLAVGGAALGLAFCLFMSFGMYGMERYQESLPARITLALTITSLATTVTVLVALLAFAAAAAIAPYLSILTPVAVVGMLASGIFVGTMVYLS